MTIDIDVAADRPSAALTCAERLMLDRYVRAHYEPDTAKGVDRVVRNNPKYSYRQAIHLVRTAYCPQGVNVNELSSVETADMERREHGPSAPRALDVICLGVPITKGSVAPYSRGGKAIAVDPRETEWEARVRAAALDCLNAEAMDAYDCPVTINGEFRMPRPARASHPYPAYQTAKTKGGGDLDKLCRAVGDALQTVNSRYLGKRRPGVIRDDARIVGWNMAKLYETDERPAGVYMTITPARQPAGQWTPKTVNGMRMATAIAATANK